MHRLDKRVKLLELSNVATRPRVVARDGVVVTPGEYFGIDMSKLPDKMHCFNFKIMPKGY